MDKRKEQNADLLIKIENLNGPSQDFIRSFIDLMLTHGRCFPSYEPDWEAVCRLLLPEQKK